jgi:hypothetical protein
VQCQHRRVLGSMLNTIYFVKSINLVKIFTYINI